MRDRDNRVVPLDMAEGMRIVFTCPAPGCFGQFPFEQTYNGYQQFEEMFTTHVRMFHPDKTVEDMRRYQAQRIAERGHRPSRKGDA